MSAPLNAPSSENLSSSLARDWAVQVDTADDSETPAWTYVLGLSQFAPRDEPNMQDDGDINSGGYTSQTPTEQTLTVECAGLRKGKLTGSTLVADPGQEFLRLKGRQLGGKNYATVRYWRTDGIAEAYEARMTVQWVNGTEGKDGLYSFNLTLTSRGAPIEIEKPSTEADNSTPSTPLTP